MKDLFVTIHGDASPEVQRLVRETLAKAGFNVEQPPPSRPALRLVADGQQQPKVRGCPHHRREVSNS